MKNLLFILCCTLFVQFTIAQITDPNDPKAVRDSLEAFSEREIANEELEIHRPKISDYQYWTIKDFRKSVIDTTLRIDNLYQQNFTQKDNFGKMAFPNFGQTFNPLSYQNKPNRLHLLPTGKSFNYLYAEDVKYYDVKTPVTEFIYENGLREGHSLSTNFTHNLSKEFNYFFNYRGLKSAGRYLNSLAANNAFTAGLSYKSKKDKFNLWSHFTSQNIDNQENGGIKDLNQFIYDDSLRTTNRQNIEVNLNNTDTEFDARRFYLGASYKIFGGQDSLQTQSPLRFKNVFLYEKQKFYHAESKAENFFQSTVFSDMERRNRKYFETLQNTTSLEFNWGEKLFLEAGFRYENLKLYSPDALVQGLVYIPKQVDDQLMGAIGKLYFDWNDRINLYANAEFKSGEFFKNQYLLDAKLDIQPIEGYHIIGGAMLESAYPSLNLLFNQSFYKDFNYFNASFVNTHTQKLFGSIDLEKFKTKIEANLYNIENYVYVDRDYKPKQLDSNVSLFQVKAENLLTYKHFNLRTTVEYQEVTQNEDFLPLPNFIGRASLYWQNKVFEQKAEVQIGINANYFSKFESRSFFPVINEFMLQRTDTPQGIQEIGGFPILDFFLNIKVDRMRIFLRAEHFNSLWGENNYYSAPYVPYRDFKVQVGVKWYLFT